MSRTDPSGLGFWGHTEEAVVWTQIRRLHEFRLVRQMYVWLLLVPVLARALAHLPEDGTFSIFGQEVVFSLTLPFSWRVFYFSAVCFVISNIVYQFFCPRLIKDHPSYASFEKEGKGLSHLGWYNRAVGCPLDGISVAHGPDRSPLLQEPFWEIHTPSNLKHRWARVTAGVLFAVGLVLIAIVAGQGMWAVSKICLA